MTEAEARQQLGPDADRMFNLALSKMGSGLFDSEI